MGGERERERVSFQYQFLSKWLDQVSDVVKEADGQNLIL